jgi:hypothetical protein
MALTKYRFECAFGAGFRACTTSFLVEHNIARDVCTSRVAQIQTGRLGFTELLDCSFCGDQCNVDCRDHEALGFTKLMEGRFGAD